MLLMRAGKTFKSRNRVSRGLPLKCFVLICVCAFLLAGCAAKKNPSEPTIEFTKIPPADEGGPTRLETIEGRVLGNRPGQQIVLYAYSKTWWIQPFTNKPFTEIQADSRWSSQTHLGTEYAALLVEAGYRPLAKTDELPEVGGAVLAVARVPGTEDGAVVPNAPPKTIQFSGYEWKVGTNTSERGGGAVTFDADNVWTDERGFLHLRIRQVAGKWKCATLTLTRSLGYGTYRLTVRDASRLEPAAVLSMSTYDERESKQNHREMDIEITRWGDATHKNLRFVVQPYDVPANVARFDAPNGTLTHSLRWDVGTAEFKTVRGDGSDPKAPPVAEHLFTSGIPAPGSELVTINFYAFRYAKTPLQNDTEVVIEKFEFLP